MIPAIGGYEAIILIHRKDQLQDASCLPDCVPDSVVEHHFYQHHVVRFNVELYGMLQSEVLVETLRRNWEVLTVVLYVIFCWSIVMFSGFMTRSVAEMVKFWNVLLVVVLTVALKVMFELKTGLNTGLKELVTFGVEFSWTLVSLLNMKVPAVRMASRTTIIESRMMTGRFEFPRLLSSGSY
jgi:hypothetical protein